jgi:hypothetical protein
MTDQDDPDAIHVPGITGEPICGTPFGRTSAILSPTCPACRDRAALGGMEAGDAFNPALVVDLDPAAQRVGIVALHFPVVAQLVEPQPRVEGALRPNRQDAVLFADPDPAGRWARRG